MLLSTASPEKRIYMSKAYSKAAAGTFILNKTESIHRWYSYLEGYSSCLIDDLICSIGVDNMIRASKVYPSKKSVRLSLQSMEFLLTIVKPIRLCAWSLKPK